MLRKNSSGWFITWWSQANHIWLKLKHRLVTLCASTLRLQARVLSCDLSRCIRRDCLPLALALSWSEQRRQPISLSYTFVYLLDFVNLVFLICNKSWNIALTKQIFEEFWGLHLNHKWEIQGIVGHRIARQASCYQVFLWYDCRKIVGTPIFLMCF